MNSKKIIAIKRIKDDLKELNDNPLTNFNLTVGTVDDNIFEWQCSIQGPLDSAYAGGLFYLRIYFPEDYPEKQPEICFKTPIYHLNVNPRKCESKENPERLGHVCISTLNCWKPEYKMRKVLTDIFSFFYRASPDSPYGLDRKTEYEENFNLYTEKAKRFTQIYASPTRLVEDEFEDQWDFINY